MPTSSPDVVQTYWDHHRLSGGGRAERMAAQGLFWAHERVQEAMHGPVRRALAVLDALLAHPAADLLHVGAGPLERLLTRTDVRVDDEAELRRVPATAPFLTACPH